MCGRIVKYSFGAFLVALLLAAIFLPSYIADSLYKNVDDISDGEMPPTVTAFQSGPEVVSSIGGSGEGLNCSLPPLTNIYFDASSNQTGKRHLVLQRFRQACVFHDLCYRHGLATYGYNQNDCDRTLQNEAFRLCQYVHNEGKGKNSPRCQLDSKLILAGVSIGGYGAYRAWDRSTFFEFESDPGRSNGYSVSRVVQHPFKTVDPAKYQNDPDEVILIFDNIRSNLTITCVTCSKVPWLQWTNDTNSVGAELQSIGINKLPESLMRHGEQSLSDTNAIWLPPRRRHAAPHLLVDTDGKHRLIWMSRNNLQNTMSCIVTTDAARLVTHTLPALDLCASGARSTLSMVEVDMFATSPLPMIVPNSSDKIFATAITPQIGPNNSLSFCSRATLKSVTKRKGPDRDDRARCRTFSEAQVSAGAALGAFQNFATIRPGEQIIFARDIDQRTTSPFTRAWQRIRGIPYSSEGELLALSIGPPETPNGAIAAKLRKIVRFDIDDRFDPMMPITRKVGDLRFLALEASGDIANVRMVDFDKPHPQVESVKLTAVGEDLLLHRSWIQRPMIVVETSDPQPTTKLVFSRAELTPNVESDVERAKTDTLKAEIVVFERDAASSNDKPFVKAGGVSCKITYTFSPNVDYPCTRAFDPTRPMRSSPASRMQASQLVVGRFTQSKEHSIAFSDFCKKGDPLILKPDPIQGTYLPVASDKNASRKVTCAPLNDKNAMTSSISLKDL